MKSHKKNKILLSVFLVVSIIMICVFLLPIARQFNTDMNAYETQRAYRNDYTLHTTPLSEEVVKDICTKLEIKDTSEHCQLGTLVYAPDFFDEIKAYFEGVPDQEKTFITVQSKLDRYLVRCRVPDIEGYYSCKYDIRGDNKYPLFFRFNNFDFYYEILIPTGGS